jgi:hypothetical protein
MSNNNDNNNNNNNNILKEYDVQVQSGFSWFKAPSRELF